VNFLQKPFDMDFSKTRLWCFWTLLAEKRTKTTRKNRRKLKKKTTYLSVIPQVVAICKGRWRGKQRQRACKYVLFWSPEPKNQFNSFFRRHVLYGFCLTSHAQKRLKARWNKSRETTTLDVFQAFFLFLLL
jgi:hypothetical protein